MIDRTKIYLQYGEFEIISKDRWEPRHQYLKCPATVNQYKHDKYEYMPSIIAFGSQEGISHIQWEVCPAKALYGHNLQEITPSEFNKFVDKSIYQLHYAGINTDKETLRKHYLSLLDVNKLAIYPAQFNIARHILQQTPPSSRFEKPITLYSNGGQSVYNNLSHRKLNIYNKTAQSEELEYAPREILELLQQAPFTLLNIEYRMQGKAEIDEEFRVQGLKLANTLENAFNPQVAQTILKNRVSQFFAQMFTVDLSQKTAILNGVQTYCMQIGKSGPQAKSALLNGILAIGVYGLDTFQDFLCTGSDRKNALQFIKTLRGINIPCLQEEKVLKEVVFSALESMQPVTIQSLKEANDAIKRGLFPPQSGCNTRKIPTRPLLQPAGEFQ